MQAFFPCRSSKRINGIRRAGAFCTAAGCFFLLFLPPGAAQPVSNQALSPDNRAHTVQEESGKNAATPYDFAEELARLARELNVPDPATTPAIDYVSELKPRYAPVQPVQYVEDVEGPALLPPYLPASGATPAINVQPVEKSHEKEAGTPRADTPVPLHENSYEIALLSPGHSATFPPPFGGPDLDGIRMENAGPVEAGAHDLVDYHATTVEMPGNTENTGIAAHPGFRRSPARHPACRSDFNHRAVTASRRLFGHPGAMESPKDCPSCGLLGCERKRCGRFYVDGWIDQGVTLNFHWPEGETNGPIRYNDIANEYDLNQVYLIFARQIEKRPGHWSWGMRADLLYGSDYLYTSSIGLETYKSRTFNGINQAVYDPANAHLRWNSNSGVARNSVQRNLPAAMYGLSMPQLYAEIFIPNGYGATFRAGHFYADMGHESPMAAKNFFYSHSYGFMYGMPTTFTGFTLEQRLTRHLSVLGGLTQGWDVWESPNKSVGWLGGLRWKSLDGRTKLSFLLSADRPSERDDYRTNYSLTFSTPLSARLEYALEHTLGHEEDGIYGSKAPGTARWYSLAQYLKLQLSEKLALGFRGEWFCDDGHGRILRSGDGPVIGDQTLWSVSGRNYYELTLGLHWKPTRYLTIRPEVRYDWSDVAVSASDPLYHEMEWKGVYNNGTKKEQVTFGVDMLLRF